MTVNNFMFKKLYPFLMLLSLLSCGGETAVPTLMPTAVPLITHPPQALIPTPRLTPLAPATPFPTATAMPSATPVRFSVTADSAVPDELVQAAQQAAQTTSDQWVWQPEPPATLVLQVGGGVAWAEWVYAVAAPFATVADDLTWEALQAAWAGSSADSLVLDEETASLFTALWGPPQGAQVVAADRLRQVLWAERPSFTLLPFHQLTPDLKVLRLDGVSPLDANFSPALYRLTIPFGLAGTETARFAALNQSEVISNYHAEKLTRVVMTGVTALVRATAYQMELNGVLYPGTEVAAVMKTADITHVSNEVAFAPDCPYPNPIGGTTFCSREQYFPLLQEIGVDVVELTGNHVNDWGRENLVYTLDMYDAAGMVYFGGGRNSSQAAEAAVFTHHGNQIAFVGCNPVGPANAWATENGAGSRPCDDGFYEQIGRLQREGVVVIATLQYFEDYRYSPTRDQVIDFQAVAEAGATAVSGSQGHHAQGFAFYQDRFIHYGLGNLFFDQMDQLGTRQMFVDRYVIYNGRLLSVELWTGLIENWAHPRPMTQEERTQLLTTVFQASGW